MTKASLYNREWRERNPEKWQEISRRAHTKRYSNPEYRTALVARNRELQGRIAQICQELKATTSCADCQRTDEPYLMDFDHLVKDTTYRSPASARTLKELAKHLEQCEIVCVRCHRIRTYKRRTNRDFKTNRVQGVSRVPGG